MNEPYHVGRLRLDWSRSGLQKIVAIEHFNDKRMMVEGGEKNQENI
jgi:hypothetical protein